MDRNNQDHNKLSWPPAKASNVKQSKSVTFKDCWRLHFKVKISKVYLFIFIWYFSRARETYHNNIFPHLKFRKFISLNIKGKMFYDISVTFHLYFVLKNKHLMQFCFHFCSHLLYSVVIIEVRMQNDSQHESGCGCSSTSHHILI